MATLPVGRHLVRGATLACILAVSATAAPTHEPRCRGNSGLIGRCHWIRGVYELSGDAAMILDLDDTDGRILVRSARRNRSPEPGNLIRFATKMMSDTGDMALVRVHGLYEVCPVPQDGNLNEPYACIQSATHLKRVSTDWMSPFFKMLRDRAAAQKMEKQLGIGSR